MARLVHDNRLETRSARLLLRPRKAPYFRSLEPGLALGYRRGKTGGVWIGRRYAEDGSYETARLGIADDKTDSDGKSVLSYANAIKLAREWWQGKQSKGAAQPHADYTVDQALDDYIAHLEAKGSRGLHGTKGKIKRIRPALGGKLVQNLTPKDIAEFQASLANTPRLGCTGKPVKRRGSHDEHSIKRARQATANRTMTALKAALNLAYRMNYAQSDNAWRRVAPFPNTSAPRVRYLQRNQIAALDEKLPANFQPIARAAALTGGRYRELAELRVLDIDLQARTVLFRVTKNGKPRHVPLVDDAILVFAKAIEGKKPQEFVFHRSPARPWKTSEQIRVMRKACEQAGIEPAISFHDLRHTFGALLAEAGASIQVIAELLGHSDTRITEKHYAHLTPSYVATTLRARFPSLGLELPVIDANTTARKRGLLAAG